MNNIQSTNNIYGHIYLSEIIDETSSLNHYLYVGQHKADAVRPLGTLYKGSGRIIKDYISGKGSKNIKTTILDTALTLEELNEKEIYWIAVYKSYVPELMLNVVEGGSGTPGLKGELNPMWGKHHSEKTKELIRSIHKGNAYSKGFKHIHKGEINTKVRPEELEDYLADGWELGRSEGLDRKCKEILSSKEVKEKMSKASSGNTRVRGYKTMHKNGIDTRVNPDKVQEYLDNGWEFGATEETHKKLSQGKLGNKNALGKHWKLSEEFCQNMSKWASESRWIHKDGVLKKVHLTQLQSYLDDGWILGMMKKKKDTNL